MNTATQTDICARFKYEDIELTLFWDGATQGNKCRIDYLFKKGANVLMQGDDFCTPSYPDSVQSVVELLGFLCVQVGDTDKEYFANHTPEMMQWTESLQRDEIHMHVDDYETKVQDAAGDYIGETFFNQHVEIMP